MHSLADIKLFLLDMDGTFYLGDQLLPGAKEFLRLLDEKGIAFTFLTNNSSKSKQDYIQKLAGLGVEIQPSQMFTSGDATLLYMEQNQLPKEIFLMGTPSLHQQFARQGYDTRAQNPQCVVLGFDTTLDYAGLTDLCNHVRAGLPYIATHPDFNCPVSGGYIPDIGAVIAYVQASCGRRPDVVVGKPNAMIAQGAASLAGVALQEVCMVGDRLYTDIALGQAGVHTALVLCGESCREDLAHSEFVPDYVFENLAEMADQLAQAPGA